MSAKSRIPTVNMSPAELRAFARSPHSKLFGTQTGQKSLRRLPGLLEKPRARWTKDDHKFAATVAAFNGRHLAQGTLGKARGKSGLSGRHGALMLWGHDVRKSGSPLNRAHREWTRSQK